MKSESSLFHGVSKSSNSQRRRRRAFTLVEAVASIALVGVGVTSAMSGLAAMSKSDRLIREREVMQRLAVQKFDELIATNQVETAELNGDFAEYNEDRYAWTAVVEPSGEENLEIVTVIVNRVGDEEGPQATVDGLMFNPPIEGGAE